MERRNRHYIDMRLIAENKEASDAGSVARYFHTMLVNVRSSYETHVFEPKGAIFIQSPSSP